MQVSDASLIPSDQQKEHAPPSFEDRLYSLCGLALAETCLVHDKLGQVFPTFFALQNYWSEGPTQAKACNWIFDLVVSDFSLDYTVYAAAVFSEVEMLRSLDTSLGGIIIRLCPSDPKKGAVQYFGIKSFLQLSVAFWQHGPTKFERTDLSIVSALTNVCLSSFPPVSHIDTAKIAFPVRIKLFEQYRANETNLADSLAIQLGGKVQPKTSQDNTSTVGLVCDVSDAANTLEAYNMAFHKYYPSYQVFNQHLRLLGKTTCLIVHLDHLYWFRPEKTTPKPQSSTIDVEANLTTDGGVTSFQAWRCTQTIASKEPSPYVHSFAVPTAEICNDPDTFMIVCKPGYISHSKSYLGLRDDLAKNDLVSLHVCPWHEYGDVVKQLTICKVLKVPGTTAGENYYLFKFVTIMSC